jgi:hypothetical protein
MAYLQALGTDVYVSRAQLPAAAVTHRLAIVRDRPPEVPSGRVGEQSRTSRGERSPVSGEARIPRLEIAGSSPKQPEPARPATPAPAAAGTVPRFSLTAIAAGGWLWLEQLQGSALAGEQLQLVQAMAHALGRIHPRANETESARPIAARPSAARPIAARPNAARPEYAQFDWPIHNNAQLDLGMEAARSSVAGFIQRKLDQYNCIGLVLLGQACEAIVPVEQIDCELLLRTLSSAEMLADSRLKKQAWAQLRQSAGGQ